MVLVRYMDGQGVEGKRRSAVGPAVVVDVAIEVVPGIGEGVRVSSRTVVS